MKDFVSKGEGKSRFLKSVSNFLTLYPDYQTFANALKTGTLPVDFNGVNPAGVTEMGTALNKANLLTDATATALGLSVDPTPNDAFLALNNNANSRATIEVVSYTGNGNTGASHPCSITFTHAPKAVLFLGTGAGGAQMSPYYDAWIAGGSGYYKMIITPDSLTTSYAVARGFCSGGNSSYNYGKKSSDGKTLSWYNTDAQSDPGIQLNLLNTTYYFAGVY